MTYSRTFPGLIDLDPTLFFHIEDANDTSHLVPEADATTDIDVVYLSDDMEVIKL